jgi:hypothetical protein
MWRRCRRLPSLLARLCLPFLSGLCKPALGKRATRSRPLGCGGGDLLMVKLGPVDDWLYWMRPDERQWFWWESRMASPDAGLVSVEVADWPAAVGSLLWLLRASGVDDLVVEGVA